MKKFKYISIRIRDDLADHFCEYLERLGEFITENPVPKNPWPVNDFRKNFNEKYMGIKLLMHPVKRALRFYQRHDADEYCWDYELNHDNYRAECWAELTGNHIPSKMALRDRYRTHNTERQYHGAPIDA